MILKHISKIDQLRFENSRSRPEVRPMPKSFLPWPTTPWSFLCSVRVRRRARGPTARSFAEERVLCGVADVGGVGANVRLADVLILPRSAEDRAEQVLYVLGVTDARVAEDAVVHLERRARRRIGFRHLLRLVRHAIRPRLVCRVLLLAGSPDLLRPVLGFPGVTRHRGVPRRAVVVALLAAVARVARDQRVALPEAGFVARLLLQLRAHR